MVEMTWTETGIAAHSPCLCVRNLQDAGLPLVEFGQGFPSMGLAAAEFLHLLTSRELRHGGNPIAAMLDPKKRTLVKASDERLA
jgi:hypothetical protein